MATDPGAAARGWDPARTAAGAAKRACLALGRGDEALELVPTLVPTL